MTTIHTNNEYRYMILKYMHITLQNSNLKEIGFFVYQSVTLQNTNEDLITIHTISMASVYKIQ